MKVLVICDRRFNGHQFWVALGTLLNAGVEFEVVSTDTTIVEEGTNQSHIIQRTVDEVDPTELADLDGLMFISGFPLDTRAYWKHAHVLEIVKVASIKDKPIAAICASVPTVREAAKGKRVSVYPLIAARELLTNSGAFVQPVSLTVDGNLVTAENEMMTELWAKSFVAVLKGEEPPIEFLPSDQLPKARERRPVPALERVKKAYARENNDT